MRRSNKAFDTGMAVGWIVGIGMLAGPLAAVGFVALCVAAPIVLVAVDDPKNLKKIFGKTEKE